MKSKWLIGILVGALLCGGQVVGAVARAVSLPGRNASHRLTRKLPLSRDVIADGIVYVDANGDGKITSSAPRGEQDLGLEGVSVALLDADGNQVQDTKTDEDGRFSFIKASDTSTERADKPALGVGEEPSTSEYLVKIDLGSVPSKPYKFRESMAASSFSREDDLTATAPAGHGLVALSVPELFTSVGIGWDPLGFEYKSIETGTGQWDKGDEPGSDSSASNDIIRTGDALTSTWDITTYTASGDSRNPEHIIFEQTVETDGSSVYIDTKDKRACSDATTVSYPSNTELADYQPSPMTDDKVVFTCEFARLATDSKVTLPVAMHPVNTSKPGSTLKFSSRIYAVDANGAALVKPSHSLHHGPFTVSAKPSWNVAVDKQWGGQAERRTIRRDGEDVSVPGYTYYYALTASSERKFGQAAPGSDFDFDVQLEAVSLATSSPAQPRQDGTGLRYYLTDVVPIDATGWSDASYPNGARNPDGSPANVNDPDDTATVQGNGTTACERKDAISPATPQTGHAHRDDTAPYTCRAKGVDFSGTSYPKRGIDGHDLNSGPYYTYALGLGIFVPAAEIDRADGVLDGKGELSAVLSIKNLSPDFTVGQASFGPIAYPMPGDDWAAANITASSVSAELDGERVGSGIAEPGSIGQAQAGEPVVWRLDAALTDQGTTAKDVTITAKLRKGVEYDAEKTAMIVGGTPADKVKQNSGGATLTWKISDVEVGSTIAPRQIYTRTDAMLGKDTTAKLTAEITSSSIPYNRLKQNAAHSVRILRARELRLHEYTNKSVTIADDDQLYTLKARNFTATAIEPVSIYDTLPFDGGGSRFSGESYISGIPVAYDGKGATLPGKFWFTTVPPAQVPTGADGDTDPAIWQTWDKAKRKEYTGFKFVAQQQLAPYKDEAKSQVVIKFWLDQRGNHNHDQYTNHFTLTTVSLRVGSGYKVLTSNQVDAHIQQYTLGDLIWLDKWPDGRFDSRDEPAPAGVKVEIWERCRQPGEAVDLGDPEDDGKGNEWKVAETVTDANGRWLVSDLKPGKYFALIPESEFAAGGKLEGLMAAVVGAAKNPNDGRNEDHDHHGFATVRADVRTPQVVLMPEYAGAAILGGKAPLGDNVGKLAALASEPDDFTNLTLDIALVKKPQVSSEPPFLVPSNSVEPSLPGGSDGPNVPGVPDGPTLPAAEVPVAPVLPGGPSSPVVPGPGVPGGSTGAAAGSGPWASDLNEPQVAAAGEPETLPFTGSDVAGIALAGLLTTLVGAGLVLRRRR
ncbi:MAG: hypothetical protein LBR21_03080 [Propionibacteriaceae bacterium]|jgi:hypothetical protein|nr:hypothetical protein [Propionibacteriaceae bacterium]